MFEYLVDVEILKRSRNICSPSHLSSKQAIAGIFFTVYLISVDLDQCFLDTFIIPMIIPAKLCLMSGHTEQKQHSVVLKMQINVM